LPAVQVGEQRHGEAVPDASDRHDAAMALTGSVVVIDCPQVGSDEGLWVMIGVVDETVDGGPEIARAKDAALEPALG
jgi:hypothetical protein